MDASLPTGKVIGAQKDETAVYQEENPELFEVDPLMDTASKCPNVINQGLHKHHRGSIMNRNTGMNAGQIIGTMNGQQVVGLDIAKKVFQLHTVGCSHTVLYVIGMRTKEMFDNALGSNFAGMLMSDGYMAYRSTLNRLRCWAHLQRKLCGVTDLLARAIHAARLGLPAPALPPVPTQLLGRQGALVGM